MSATASTKITPVDGPLETITPHLMPFHIAHTGPAPISTYFRVTPLAPPTYGRDATSTPPDASDLQQTAAVTDADSQTTLAASSSSSLAPGSDSTLAATPADEDVSMRESGGASHDPTDPSVSSPRHFGAAFRGRGMHGTVVDLPDGYAGLVLRVVGDTGATNVKSRAAADSTTGKRAATRSASKGKEKSKGEKAPVKAKGRAARKSARAEAAKMEEAVDVDALPESGVVEDAGAAEGDGAGEERVLRPEGTFGSFVLWNPDVPVDEARDEYVRALTEWTRMAAEVRVRLRSLWAMLSEALWVQIHRVED
ncbi:ribonuclease H2, subunit C [Epithele typhae]|uniref:ribonuclease H2, subunit C n=1 Tax=Epithele typhae TaxID=378194 RepID=UPI0020087031|nr:ribonuclease H2, subunit C [Epithele typhae]KAH9940739.1 ribonuclease H2, subunit C [Epithele typhae]